VPRFDAAIERLVGLIQPRQHLLQNLRVNRTIVGHCRLQVGQLRLLLMAGERDATASPGSDALFQGGVVDRAAAPHGLRQHPLQFGCWPEFVLADFMRALVAHSGGFLLSGVASWTRRASAPSRIAR
jgi:hypothetical protein